MKEIVITGRTGPRRFQFALRLAPQHTFTVTGNVLRVFDRDGVEWLHSPPAFGHDANGEPVSVSMTLGDTVTYRGKTYPTVWVELSAQDHAEADLPIVIDPTATVSGASSIEDAMLNGGDATVKTRNYGSSNYFSLQGTGASAYGGRQFLSRISTVSIPSGAISAMRFYAYCSGSNVTRDVHAYRCTDGKAWVEGTADGSTQSGSCCFNYAVDNTLSWGTAGCLLSGTDYIADASPPSMTITSPTDTNSWKTIALLPSWATAWRDAIAVNNGFVLLAYASGSASNFKSSEAASDQPYFEIDYSAGAAQRAHLSRMRRF
jgi:hypothetical protein